jgi:hypothetical protein
VRLEHECSITAPLAKLGLNPWLTGSLAQTPMDTFLVRGQGSEFDANQVVVSSIGASGALGTSVPLLDAVDGYLYAPIDMVATEGGLAAIWQEIDAVDSHGFYFAKLDEAGAVTQARTLVTGIEGRLSPARIAAGATGYAALYSTSNDDFTMSSVMLGILDDAGALVGEPKSLHAGSDNVSAGAILAVPGGYAVTYSVFGTEAQSYLAFVDEEGTTDGEPIPLGERAEFSMFTQSLLLRGDELIVAFSQQTGGYDNSDIAHTVHLARFDATTHVATLPGVALQAAVEDQENVQPRLVTVGDDIGIVWSQGGVIYICAGCMPDNHLEFVVLDGEDFTPVSELVTLENTQPMGGFILPQIAGIEDELLITSTLQYHVSGEGAFGSVRCTPAP